MRGLLEEQARRHRVALSENQVDQFLHYLTMIQKWQKTAVRLVGSAEPDELVGKHVSDALALYMCIGDCAGKKLIDIGSGAGFPGLCLKVIEPGLDVTLVEASARKSSFLAKVKVELGLRGLSVVRGRGEDIACERRFCEQFDFATLRAVASLPLAIELGLPFVKVGGRLFLVRGASSDEEIETASLSAAPLGGGQVTVRPLSVEGGDEVRGSIMIVGRETGADGEGR
jgi:16S rRNA (guanine527-N7)-methyltransferase